MSSCAERLRIALENHADAVDEQLKRAAMDAARGSDVAALADLVTSGAVSESEALRALAWAEDVVAGERAAAREAERQRQLTWLEVRAGNE